MTINEAACWLKDHDNYCILTHRNPDGDTIGCAAGLCRGLREIGKQAVILENPQFTPRYDCYLDGLVSATAAQNATVISVDMASESLLPDPFNPLAGQIALAIDHHGSNTGFAPNTLIEADSAACGELVFLLLQALEAPICPETADALYLAISTDTGCFQYSNTTSRTLRIAADLKDLGSQTAAINKIMFDTKSFARIQLESRLTDCMERLAGGLVALCRLPISWMDELGLSEDDIDSISSFPRTVEGVQVGAMLRELPNGAVKLSLRTGPNYNASDICALLGGGGHNAAAGATIQGDFEAARTQVLDALRQKGVAV